MKSFRYAVLSILLCCSTEAFSWDSFGHMLIAELALDELSPAKQRQIEQEAFSLVRQQASKQRLYLMRTFPDTSAFAQLSVFADTHRNETIAALYAKFASKIPSQFASIAEETTTSWHYKNQFFQDLSAAHPEALEPLVCEDDSKTNVAWAVKNLQLAFKEAETPEDKALAMGLLIHFVGDAHQPLHGISRVDAQCRSDRGGNAFCVAYRGIGKSCEKTLHAHWDQSLGFYKEYATVAEAVDYISRVKVKDSDVEILNPDTWLKESFSYARFVYSLKEGDEGDSYYINEGQIISYQRQALAAKRLARILDELY